MDLQRLRREIASDHERVERLIPLMEPTLTLQQYTTVLARLYGLVKGWDDWALRHAPEDLQSVVASRCRSGLLEEDLAHFGVPVPEPRAIPQIPSPVSRPAFLGAMYVMEGSTLGGQYIARHVEEALHLRRGEGDAYFVAHGPGTEKLWREFQALLLALAEEDAISVIAAARDAFDRFAQWMQPPIAAVAPQTGALGTELYA